MNETTILALAGVAGLVLGGIFFGGLWWTVRMRVTSSQAALWFFGSLLVRMSVALTGFYLVGRGDWERLVLCLLGFITARLIVTWLTRPSGKKPSGSTLEASHAPESR